MAETLSIIIPTLHEADRIDNLLGSLAPLRAQGHELIVVDGGSADGTAERARSGADRVCAASRGRALQMNAGAAIAGGSVLLFLHADTELPPTAAEAVLEGLRRSGRDWGRFDVDIAGRHPMLRVIAWCMNHRSRLSRIATGDQGMFVRRATFWAVGAFPEQPLMEDIELSKRLRRVSQPLCLRTRITTSGRRWEAHGVWRTIGLMWRLRWLYWRGVSPERLASLYQ
ncbi:TIGR04283 family arsenosugar biosynthesis glycosyltransferase [Methylotetracoccus oryzae]|uniref:TIGR04283 family arsenosugar biosynthesis glycosyltransferase n=1 Tax=Methylotetracoccus oryzae TaxID=1919059 RepID=UPI001913C13E|nr:TIGR04283 family arsenosugar biosynthesis glycosyltransferase [Methylotetracoccus oryzae]